MKKRQMGAFVGLALTCLLYAGCSTTNTGSDTSVGNITKSTSDYKLSDRVEPGAYVSLETMQAYIEEMHGTSTWAIRKNDQDIFQIVGLRADESSKQMLQSADFRALEYLYDDTLEPSSVMSIGTSEALMDPEKDQLVYFSTKDEPPTTFETAGGIYYAVPLIFERNTGAPEKDKIVENKVYQRSLIEQNVAWERTAQMQDLTINGTAPENMDGQHCKDGYTHKDYLINDVGAMFEIPDVSEYYYIIVDNNDAININGQLGASLYEAKVNPSILFTRYHDSQIELKCQPTADGYAIYDIKDFAEKNSDFGPIKSDGSTKRIVLGMNRYLGFVTE